ncbi:unnamed protein product [Cuscuta europaea]|uniref:DNA helicase Pif1-like 2B domain-containing protein n=1 Tax=Cuscuta europaea TaxID=41803 RepID=A0A9P1EDX8_CUSEU|nr:unnamed protein product [Cuscuta europaea]
MLLQNSSEEKTYFSSDSACSSTSYNELLQEIHSPEFLNGIKCSGVPSHELKLKVGVPVMLMRNIDHSAGLCNGTRLLVTKLGEHIIEAQMMYGTNAVLKVMSLSGLKFVICDDERNRKKTAKNVVYKEGFNNLQNCMLIKLQIFFLLCI